MAASPSDELKRFVEALKKKTDPARLDKSMAMLRADRFQLFVDADDSQISGVVKSQRNITMLYSCRISSAGDYSCCTQNLNVCGGLRGAVCKHILVLVVGLVRSEQLTAAQALSWIGASQRKRPALDRDRSSEILIRYKGAESGEVDWRPTETLPEDYYAL